MLRSLHSLGEVRSMESNARIPAVGALSLPARAIRAIPLVLAWACVIVIAFSRTAREGYLYASTLGALFWLCVYMYFETFRAAAWGEPPANSDRSLPKGWKRNSAVLLASAAGSALVIAVIWFASSYLERPNSGGWYCFYFVLFSVFVAGTWHGRGYLNVRAAVVTALAMDVLLSSYEHLLLGEGTGWDYHGTEVHSLFDVPIENMLFVYPMASALCSLLGSMAARRWNHLRAFWTIMGLLSVVFVVVEFVGIWVFHLWSVTEFADKSIFPFLRTNIEEFIYYFLFQALSLLLYFWLHQNLDPVADPRRPHPVGTPGAPPRSDHA